MRRSSLVWVLAGGLLFGVVARAETKTDPIADYKTYLMSLPKDDPASITKAINQYQAAIVPLDMDKRAKAFLDFLDFHGEICKGVCWTFRNKPDDLVVFTSLPENEAVRNLCHYGLNFRGDACDGYYVAGIPEYLPRMFSSFLPKSVQRYLDLREAETHMDYEVDAVLLISYAQVAQRVAIWDRYLRNYPDSPMRTEAAVLRAQYLLDLLTGVANSPLDPATADCSKNIRGIYAGFLRAHPGTYAAKLIRDQYRYLRKKEFFSKPFDPYDRTACDRHDEIKKDLCRTVNLDEYWMNPESGYRAEKIKSK
jgi:hypothetical protein